jgi:16S rRNA (adenine1518-N6/adenine1519-N6)-dimethyltransferase
MDDPAPQSPPSPAPRQTLSYLKRLLESHRLEAKSKLGQNFLIDLNLLDSIVRTAELTREDSVLEVGTGTGTLTNLLAGQAGAVFTVEIDHEFHRLAREIVGDDRPNVVLFRGDALARKNELNPDVLAGWAALTRANNCTRRKLIANLPYVIATPVISNLLLTDIPIERMVAMVQWEIAERLRATPGTKDYNALSVLVQSVSDVETVRKVPPAVFHPRPKVDSAVILIRPNPEKRAKVGDVVKFRAFLRDLYVHRRKNLRQALSGWPQGRREKADVDAKLAELGIDGSLRAEALDLEQHLRLSRVFG